LPTLKTALRPRIIAGAANGLTGLQTAVTAEGSMT
jgi:hypothetical protein